MGNKKGRQSIIFTNPPGIISAANTVGEKEKRGPLGDYFDEQFDDKISDKKTWEITEGKMQERVVDMVMQRVKAVPADIRYLCGGDLLSQLMATTFGTKKYEIPYFGLFGACSTFGEAMQLCSILVDGGLADKTIAISSSHYCSAERQFRFPVEFGYQRPKSAGWTTTAAAAVIIGKGGTAARIRGITTGKMVDYGIADALNMGGAMAPAAADTLAQHFSDFTLKPSDYDLIVTGDLGLYGSRIFVELMQERGFDIRGKHFDCGAEIYAAVEQDTHAGGSGCGCSGAVFTGYILQKIKKGIYKKVLFMPTGALLTTVSTNLKETIPAIAHALIIEGKDVEEWII